MALRFDALIRAHGFMKTERPPEIWEADTEDVRFLPLLGEMIAAGISGGSPLAELTLNVSNVVNAPGADDEGDVPAGEFVGVTVRGETDLGADHVWRRGLAPGPRTLLGRLDTRLLEAGAVFAYVRRIPPEGSVTVFLRRSE